MVEHVVSICELLGCSQESLKSQPAPPSLPDSTELKDVLPSTLNDGRVADFNLGTTTTTATETLLNKQNCTHCVCLVCIDNGKIKGQLLPLFEMLVGKNNTLTFKTSFLFILKLK